MIIIVIDDGDDDDRSDDVNYLLMVIITVVIDDSKVIYILLQSTCSFLKFRFTPESIRWYTTHNRIEKAEKELRNIARINRKEYPEVMIKVPATSTKSLGCLALFSTWSLAFSVMIQAVAW